MLARTSQRALGHGMEEDLLLAISTFLLQRNTWSRAIPQSVRPQRGREPGEEQEAVQNDTGCNRKDEREQLGECTGCGDGQTGSPDFSIRWKDAIIRSMRMRKTAEKMKTQRGPKNGGICSRSRSATGRQRRDRWGTQTRRATAPSGK